MGKATLLRDIAAKIAEKGKPFYSAAEKAAQELPRTKGTGAEFMRELEKTKGVKPAEIQHRKLDEIKSMPKMTKEEFVKEVQSRPAAQVEEKIIRDPSEQDYKDLARRMMDEDATEYVNNTIGIRTPRKSEQWDDLFYEELGRLERYRSKEYLERAYQQPESFDLDILTRYNDPKYLLPGGENYREMLLKLPERGLNKKEATDKMVFESMARRGELSPEQQARLDELTQKQQSMGENYQSAHWKGEPNVLAHMRVSDRVGPNGEKVLHVEEIQSDWHQAGRKKGYKGEAAKKAEQEFKSYASELASKYDLNPDQNLAMYATMKRMQPDEVAKYEQLQSAWVNSKEGVPDAPFKKNWQELAMNRLLSYAAENGYDRVALTPGAEQAQRYKLSNVLDEINVTSRTHAGTGEVSKSVALDTKDGRSLRLGVSNDGTIDNVNDAAISNFVGKSLDEVIGKDMAKKVMEGGTQTISGEGLTVGGEGMKGFYDKMLPDYLNKLGKKYGVEVDTMPLTVPPKDSMAVSKYPGGEDYIMGKTTWSEFLAQNPEAAKDFQSGLHSFQITPEMRKDIVEQGFPLYSAIAAPVGLAGAQDAAQRVGITDDEDAMKLDLMDQELREPEQNFDKGGAAFGVFPQMKGKRSKQDREASKNVPVDLLRGAVSGVLGAPGDIESLIRLLPGLNEETVLPTSEDIEKRLPFQSDTPVSRAATGLGQLAGGFYTGPGSPLKAIAGVPKAIKHGAEEFAKASAMGVPHVIKPKGGNWLDSGSVQRVIDPLQVRVRTPGINGHTEANMMADDSLNKWANRNLTNYVKKEMGTPEDPVRRLAEEGIVHIPTDQVGMNRYKANTHRATYGGEQLGKSEAARAWEDAADVAISPIEIKSLHRDYREPWMEKADQNTKVYEPTNEMHAHYLGFDHIMDVLREDLASGRIRPEQLNKVSMEQAVRRTYEYDQEMAKKMREAQIKATEGMPIHKEYPEGYKWVELAVPNKLPEKFSVAEQNGRFNIVDATTGNPLLLGRGQTLTSFKTPEEAVNAYYKQNPKVLEEALKYEGETMGHCVGGYCPDVLEGRSRIFSLRDAKGEPHVTVEVNPHSQRVAPRHEEVLAEMKASGVDAANLSESAYDAAYEQALQRVKENRPPAIVQIKGKQNRAPKEEYLPFVQDFVKSGEWSDVGDLHNTGLIRRGNVFTPTEKQGLIDLGQDVPEYLTQEDIAQLRRARGDLPPEEGMAAGGKPKYPTPEMREKLRQLRESFLPAANEAERQKRMQQNMEQTNRKVSFSDEPDVMLEEIKAATGGKVDNGLIEVKKRKAKA